MSTLQKISVLLGGVMLCAAVTSRLSAQESEQGSLDSIRIVVESPIDNASPLVFLNQVHDNTNLPVIRRTVGRTVRRGDSISRSDRDLIDRNLRRLGVFRNVEVKIDTSSGLSRNDSLRLEDAWSLELIPVTESEVDRQGIMLVERNLAGEAISIGIGGDLVDPARDDWRLFLKLTDPEILAGDLVLDASAILSVERNDISVKVFRPFHSDHDRFVYGLSGRVQDGIDLYRSGDPAKVDAQRTDTINARRVRSSAWFGVADQEDDLFAGSVALHLDRFDPDSPPPLREAFTNTLGVFVGIASIRRDYREFDRFESTGSRLAPIGGMGRVSIGKFLGIAGDSLADDVVYFGAEARQSIGGGSWYAAFSAEAGTGIQRKEAVRTMLRLGTSIGIVTGPGCLAARGGLQVAWRWPRYIYSSANSSSGVLRGYDQTEVVGDNHLSSSIEYRFKPILNVGAIEVWPTLFYDIAGFWNTDREFRSTRFHHALGGGIRFGHSDGVSRPAYRLDIAWNVDRGRVGGIVLGVSEAFNIFSEMNYTPPGPYLPK